MRFLASWVARRLMVPRSVVASCGLANFAAAAKFARRLKIVGGHNNNVEVLAEEDVGHDDDAVAIQALGLQALAWSAPQLPSS